MYHVCHCSPKTDFVWQLDVAIFPNVGLLSGQSYNTTCIIFINFKSKYNNIFKIKVKLFFGVVTVWVSMFVHGSLAGFSAMF